MLPAPVSKKETRKLIEIFLESERSDEFTIDVGAAHSPYQHLFPNRVSIDIAEYKNLQIKASVYNLPFKSESFHNVLLLEVLEHIADLHTSLSEIKRVLKPNGKLILTTRFIYPIHDAPMDYFRFTRY